MLAKEFLSPMVLAGEAQASRLSEPRPGGGNPAKPSRRQGTATRLTSGGSAAEPRDKLQLRPEVRGLGPIGWHVVCIREGLRRGVRVV